ncbi:sodium-coupled monocarboxylate transporter 1-like isoform X2 [Prorops nasuta]|uniref:sodium-coupled monocarboxylate transporter 1-like isoform X2 n=1 Tax=Prorops nasuta TaxID=863751 RepID=UPI0034CFCF51
MASEGTSSDAQMSWIPEVPTVQEVHKSMQNFGTSDYGVFAVMLIACGVVGIYYGFVKKTSGEDEYLVGGRNMKTFPVSMSLIASFISGISLLGTPTEIYVHGTSYLFIGFGTFIVGFVMSSIYLPVFHDLKLTSTYEYLELRFDKRIRLLGSILFSIAIGGLKAVVWTDFIQTFIMLGSMLLIIIKGTNDIGGLSVVLRKNLESGRLELPTTDWSPLERHTIWSLVVGGFFHYLQISAINQNMIQRYLSLPTLKSARTALWIFIIGILILMCVCGYAGLLIYAWFHDCDPLTTKLAAAKDQLLPLLVMQILGEFPGLPGLFVAGVFSAALSSLSTGLNSMAAVVFEDFIKPFRKNPLSSRMADFIMKLTVVILGVTCVALVFVVEKAGSHVLQLSISLSAITSGPTLGIFSMGILLPWVNARGALLGGLSGLSFMSWITLSAQAAIANGRIKFEEKPVTTEGCTYSFPQIENLELFLPSDTIFNEENKFNDELNNYIFFTKPWAIYRLSYLWYTVVGALVTMSVGLAISLFSSQNIKQLDPALLAPFIRKYLRPPIKNIRTIQIEKIGVKLNANSDDEDHKLETTALTRLEEKDHSL